LLGIENKFLILPPSLPPGSTYLSKVVGGHRIWQSPEKDHLSAASWVISRTKGLGESGDDWRKDEIINISPGIGGENTLGPKRAGRAAVNVLFVT